MLCPSCKNTEMVEANKEGVLIDVCPQCRGVWLDRGELEKILAAGREVRDYDQLFGERERRGYGKESHYYHGHGYDHYPKHRKKKPLYKLLEDIFD